MSIEAYNLDSLRTLVRKLKKEKMMYMRNVETDFVNTDNEWKDEVNAIRKMCEINGIRPLVEHLRSGRGAHVWMFF